jgi:hypothetical protein
LILAMVSLEASILNTFTISANPNYYQSVESALS